jgi:hypothetical protein
MPATVEPPLRWWTAEFWRVGGAPAEVGAGVSAPSAGTKFVLVTTTTAPLGDVDVMVSVVCREVGRGELVVEGGLVEVVKVVSPGIEEDGRVWGAEDDDDDDDDDDGSGSEEEVWEEVEVESLVLKDVPGSEEEGVGLGVELGVSEVGGRTLLLLEGSSLVGALVGGMTVVEGGSSVGGSEVGRSEVGASVSVWVSVSESGGVELGPSEVELSSRFASCMMELPRGASLRRTASSALWFVALPWHGICVEATPRSASMHTNMIMVLVRTLLILLVESGRWRLSAVVGWAPVAVFSRASTRRRVSEEGDLPSLTNLKAMMEDSR